VYISDRIANRLASRLTSSGELVTNSPLERLSDRELEIFRLLGHCRTPSQIAADLHLSLKTVQTYCARAKEKFGVPSLTELLRAAIQWDNASQVK
jgi:DNA-binding NarL/FixJ family response regulator